MTHYLVVANQTIHSPELERCIRGIVEAEHAPTFAILVPTQVPRHGLQDEAFDDMHVERARADEAAEMVQGLGGKVLRTSVGPRVPLLAIGDELRYHPEYDALIICTLPPGISAWLGMDLVSRASRRFDLPVTHVIAHMERQPSAHRLPHRASPRPVRHASEVPALIERMSHGAPAERREAREALVEIGREAGPALARALGDADDDVRWEAARALVDVRDPAAVPRLVDALTDEHPGVRWLVAEALVAIGAPATLPVLRELVNHSESPWLRDGAHHVLRLAASREAQLTLVPVVEALELVDAATFVLTPAHRALQELQPKSPAAVLA